MTSNIYTTTSKVIKITTDDSLSDADMFNVFRIYENVEAGEYEHNETIRVLVEDIILHGRNAEETSGTDTESRPVKSSGKRDS